MKKKLLIGLMTLVAALSFGKGKKCPYQQKEECKAIKEACLDYVEGFFEGSRERMERGIHEDLVKRNIDNDTIQQMTREQLIGYAENSEHEKPEIIVEVYDIHDTIAIAKVTSDFVDYVQLAKLDGQWKVVNVLWGF